MHRMPFEAPLAEICRFWCAVLAAITFLGVMVGCSSGEHEEAGIQVDSTDSRYRDLIALVEEGDDLGRFDRLMQRTELKDLLVEMGPYTLFAPTDRAFAAVGFGLDTLRTTASLDSLRNLLEGHVARGRYGIDRVQDSLRISTLSERSLLLQRIQPNGALVVQGRPILRTLEGVNGVIHVVGSVITPPKPDTTRTDTTTAQP